VYVMRFVCVDALRMCCHLLHICPLQMILGGHRPASMLRYLRARGMDVNKAHSMFTQSLQWREECGITEGEEPFTQDVLRSIRLCIPHSWLGFNRDGYLVFIEVSTPRITRHHTTHHLPLFCGHTYTICSAQVGPTSTSYSPK
jgi:hypothetical protein